MYVAEMGLFIANKNRIMMPEKEEAENNRHTYGIACSPGNDIL